MAGLVDPLAVDPGAVRRAEILDLERAGARSDESVAARDERVVDGQVRVRTPDQQLCGDDDPSPRKRTVLQVERWHQSECTQEPLRIGDPEPGTDRLVRMNPIGGPGGDGEVVGSLTPAERSVLASIGHVVTYAPGDRIIEEGAPASGFSIIESGLVEVVRNGRPVGRVGELGVIGEMALFNADVHTAEVRAVEPCRVLLVPAEQFVQLVLQQEPAAVKVMESLGQLMVGRVQELDAELLEQAGGGPVEELVALRKRLLAEWALAYHALGKPGKLTVSASKRVGTAADLAVAYSPGSPSRVWRSATSRAVPTTTRHEATSSE